MRLHYIVYANITMCITFVLKSENPVFHTLLIASVVSLPSVFSQKCPHDPLHIDFE